MAVIDDVLARHGQWYVPKRDLARMLVLQHTAPRFVFSRSASRLAGQFAMECSDLVLNNRQFAVPPYEQMYIEFDSKAFLEKSPYAKTSAYRGTPADVDVGYLLDGPFVYTFAHNESGDIGPTLLKLKVVRPGEAAGLDQILLTSKDEDGTPVYAGRPEGVLDEDEKIPVAEWTRMVAILGGAVGGLQSEEQRQQILSEVSFHWMGPKIVEKNSEQMAQAYLSALRGGAGEVRNLWTLLLWLNQPSRIRFVDMPSSSRLVKGKRIAYRQHRVVEIELGKSITIRRALKFEDRSSPLNHPVRGAFHSSGGSQTCTHQWPLFPDDKGHWVCEKCGRMRWWTKGHRRGDATKGFSDSQYNVKLAEKPPGVI